MSARFTPVTPADRLVPTHAPGPVTQIAHLQPGETGSDALERIGTAVLPPADQPARTGRRGRPRKLPRQLAAIIAMRTEGMGDQEIADRMHISRITIRRILQRARKDLAMSDLVDRMEHRAVPAAVDNLIDGLDGVDGPEAKQAYTLATLKGVGVFRQHSAVKQESTSETTNILRVQIELPEMPAGGQAPTVAIGAIVGMPRRAPSPVIPAITVTATPVPEE